ncbi:MULTISPECIES: phosphoribosylformylglycinamidine synthase subunit PurQ [Streptomyces]|uniref:Phosphoribosylformylglycinamidine synthase subunit PurQ n=1 Tax=Streptomyces albus (strain ATCC 21838 / DSM 41398 / FERM P-419 / JCM 4703 / NBRC 107858) TaxID=1081613 RepID=A0A0B5ENR7_STRA4|nr:phosphoribosylformylglycinamidine synthase subunit PurQ [Streptomyces sp. SCSIO ZS0520]AJE84303.1 phosphoribosylformylglycinamidine synthase I [Streptomyces albus]AOU78611.1 phosphoribosylformylglycinamidine synthase I [Streptomyces albus]AYN34352.1 phosphoribosylformylglycinamidine synthase I [Streptomyces albus]
MTSRIGVVTFPGSLDDRDTQRAIRLAGAEPVALWHKDKDLKQVDAVVLPGGFSYGDYLRAGAISRFSPVMETIIAEAKSGLPVLGICNGFQVLTEAHLLPGAMLGNNHLHFICRDQKLRVENDATAWTADFTAGQEIHIPLKNMDGRYVADARTLDMLEAEGRVVFRYVAGADEEAGAVPGVGHNPNGSLRDIAGITNETGSIVGLMPHPEHAVESLVGNGRTDGLPFFTSILKRLVSA